MEHLDEAIITARVAAKNQAAYTIENQVMIAGEPYTFERTKLFDDKMSMVLPCGFQDMPAAASKLKYPSENRPQIIKCNQDGSVSWAFNLLSMTCKKEELIVRIHEMKTALKRVNPAYLFFELNQFDVTDNTRVCQFDFRSYALDMDIYNIMFISNIGGRLAMGTFNCPDEMNDAWKPLAFQMVQTVRDETIMAEGSAEDG